MSLDLVRWDPPGPYAVAFSTRHGGVSEGVYASLNIGFGTADERERVDENRSRVVAAVGADPLRALWPRQMHGAGVVRAASRGDEADAIWTDEPGQPVMVVTADCAPVALARVGGPPAVALVHAGWRGLLAGVVPAAVSALGGELVAAIGPAIGPCCYDVDADVADPVRAAFGPDLVRNGRLDLPGAIELALRRAGCSRVDRFDECTACHPDRYFSHRRDRGITGRQGAIAVVT